MARPKLNLTPAEIKEAKGALKAELKALAADRSALSKDHKAKITDVNGSIALLEKAHEKAMKTFASDMGKLKAGQEKMLAQHLKAQEKFTVAETKANEKLAALVAKEEAAKAEAATAA